MVEKVDDLIVRRFGIEIVDMKKADLLRKRIVKLLEA